MKNQLRIIMISALFWAFPILANAQMSYSLNPEAREKMSKLAFLGGKWKGSGWMMGEDRTKSTFEQEEHIQLRLGGTALEVEGKGTSEGSLVHHAIAFLTPGKEENTFDFSSFLQNGMKGTYPARLENGALIWQPVEQVRYTIRINEQGQWHEIGEYNAGNAWYQFFEMTLEKVN